MMAQGDATNIASNCLGQREKQSLLAMKALIDRHLNEMEDQEDEAPAVLKLEGGDVEMGL